MRGLQKNAEKKFHGVFFFLNPLNPFLDAQGQVG
jgi:hypothetical protein